MSEINTSIVHSVYVKNAAGAYSPSDKIATLLSADFSGDASFAETQYQGSLWKVRQLTGLDVSGSVSGKQDASSAVLGILEAAQISGDTVYVSVITNPNAAEDAEEGKQFAFKVSSYSRSYPEAGLVEFSVSFVNAGTAPTSLVK